MNDNEEEAMELSGESALVSNLHQFSFDISWSAHDRDPSPTQVIRQSLSSPSRYQVSTPISRDWKNLTLPRRTPVPQSPMEMMRASTVKVSQMTPSSHKVKSDRRQSYSPMELDLSEHSFERQSSKPRKRYSDFCVPYDSRKGQKILTTLNKITEFRDSSKIGQGQEEARNQSTEGLSPNENNNYKEDTFDLEDSVFIRGNSSAYNNGNGSVLRERSKSKRKSLKIRKENKEKMEKKSSHVLLILMVLVSLGIAGYFLFQAGSCSVFDIDIVKLKHKLEDNVFGQQIAVNTILQELDKFGQAVKSGDSKRSLVMSFHGWTGIGKNFISKFIAESFYNAKITLFSIPWHFPHASSTEEESRKLQKKVKNWIMGNITKCGVNVFIFDEMDKAHKEFLTGLESAMEEIKSQESVLANSTVKSPIIVILFISNSKAVQINQYLFSQIGEERDREEIQIEEFSAIFNKHANNEWFSSLKLKNLVDNFIPFLPLAESHVRQCIVKSFIHKGRDPSERLIEAVMDELSFFDMGGKHGQMSLTGCKRVHDKVDLHIDD